ncbi:MAG: hypothetical protein NC548_56420, partial [Lachnospiraceae bacterium]|nr:hypothetical protein [Lachnospiraceae bacterium]
MKSQRILDALGSVEEKYIAEAAPPETGENAGGLPCPEAGTKDGKPFRPEAEEDTEEISRLEAGENAGKVSCPEAGENVETASIEKAEENMEGKMLRQKAWKGRRWLKWGALAACLALALYGGNRMLRNYFTGENPDAIVGGGQGDKVSGTPGNPGGERREELPLLTLTEQSNEAMGYEGYMAYDVSELINANP